MDRYDARAREAELLAKAARWREAAVAYDDVIAAGGSNYRVHYNYGTVLLHCECYRSALEQLRMAIAYDPSSLEALNNYAAVCQKLGDPTAAEEACRRLIASQPRHLAGWTNLGVALCDQGKVTEGIEAMRRALEIDPKYRVARDNLLLNLNYIAIDGEALAAEHRLQCAQISSSPRKPLPITKGRRIRVGYVSGDFRNHSVAFFMGGIVGTHDRGTFEVFCYSSTHCPDGLTQGFSRIADHFIDIAGSQDTEAALRIEADGIDILVDLGGHATGNRLGVFALRPAPVQVSYLGYPATTGCPFIDYRIVDEFTDPEGTEAFSTERLIRLPAPFICYHPAPDLPRVGPLPALAAEHVTFGSFNHSSKISDLTLDLWSRVLTSVPDSRMFIKAKAFSDAAVCGRFKEHFSQWGIDESRISFSGLIEDAREHLSAYGQIDVALDTFPYNGTTTTCEALWMGVPVVNLVGYLHAARVGKTILTSVGLESLATTSSDNFVALVQNLVQDVGRLSGLRSRLRNIVANSPLCDRIRFTKGLEEAYRTILTEVWECRAIQMVPSGLLRQAQVG